MVLLKSPDVDAHEFRVAGPWLQEEIWCFAIAKRWFQNWNCKKKTLDFVFFKADHPDSSLMIDVNLLCQWNGTCNMLFVQPIQKVNLGNTTFISYCVNMFLHGHRKILSYIKLGRHFFPTFQDHKAPGNSMRMLLRSVVLCRHTKLWTRVTLSFGHV